MGNRRVAHLVLQVMFQGLFSNHHGGTFLGINILYQRGQGFAEKRTRRMIAPLILFRWPQKYFECHCGNNSHADSNQKRVCLKMHLLELFGLCCSHSVALCLSKVTDTKSVFYGFSQ